MLAKCVNPVCSNQFRYLHHGKLFEVEIQYIHNVAADGDHGLGSSKAHIERYWLCDQCAEEVTLRFVKHRGLVVRSSVGLEEVAIPPSGSRPGTEISKVLIRLLDLNVAVRRDLTGSSKALRQAA